MDFAPNFSRLPTENFRQVWWNCFLRAQTSTLRISIFNNFTVSKVLLDFEESFQTSGEKRSAGLAELHPPCPFETFDEFFFLGSSAHIIPEFDWKILDFWKTVFSSVVYKVSCVPWSTYWAKTIFSKNYLLSLTASWLWTYIFWMFSGRLLTVLSKLHFASSKETFEKKQFFQKKLIKILGTANALFLLGRKKSEGLFETETNVSSVKSWVNFLGENLWD